MIKEVAIAYADGVEFHKGKRAHIRGVDRDLYLVGIPHIVSGYVDSLTFAVVDEESGAVLGLKPTKAEALSEARENFQKRSDKVTALIESKRTALAGFMAAYADRRTESAPRPINTQRLKIFNQAGGVCFYCKCSLQFDGNWHVEHKTPRSRGGSDHPSNLTAACVPCNQKKRTKTAEEFISEGQAA